MRLNIVNFRYYSYQSLIIHCCYVSLEVEFRGRAERIASWVISSSSTEEGGLSLTGGMLIAHWEKEK